ncbi:PTS sugar transporter subunit IIA [Pectinatus brassicae]|uniref:PTS system fructose-specific IIA component n=1 Tax=Pectinatus brassicae TaxID=862415 RepID=A0A840UJA7_9FIRM|nr:PTS sugar transporter subunit IIA [Pectinatus brassicae]MBB5336270.1 PTS system fructose-specific IIA component [Pectinatus brassicae]
MEINNVREIINEQLINLNLKASTKKEAIEELTADLYREGNVINPKKFIADVYYREEEGQTGLGNHIAIPHGKSDAVKITSIAFGRTVKDLKWESPDGEPVHVIILFAVRNVDKTTVHLKLLSQVAMALADDDTLNRLLETNDKTEIIQLLSQEMK